MIITLFIGLMVGLDQLVKYLVTANMAIYDTIPLLENVFHLTYIHNTGMAFGLLEGKIPFFIILTAVLVVFLIVLLKKSYFGHISGRLGIYFVIAGALGNLIDRIRLGYVVDMFDFRLINFAIFNVADVFVSIGGVLLVYYIVFQYEKEHETKPRPPQAATEKPETSEKPDEKG